MSNPYGRGRHPDDGTDATERTGELPAWGAPPPGGWGADPASTGAWSPDQDARDGWAGPGDTTRAAPVWGDESPGDQGDTWAVPTGRGGRRRAPEAPTEAVPASSPGSPGSAWGDQTTTAQPSDGAWSGGWPDAEQGGQPWEPQEAAREPRTTKKWGLIGGGAVLVVIVLVTAFLWPAWAIPRHLDQTALQTGVNQVLTEDYGLEVGAVQCPDDVVVSAGTAFSCQAVVGGEQVEVPGVVTSDEGDYQVNRV